MRSVSHVTLASVQVCYHNYVRDPYELRASVLH